MRIETIGNATLYLGDCREILPALPKVDAVITDPPYGIKRAAIAQDGAVHPTQKPVALMTWCIGQAGDPATIVDPFMGGGSTGVAALNLRREFIGIERDPAYFDIACRRIEDAQRQGRLIV